MQFFFFILSFLFFSLIFNVPVYAQVSGEPGPELVNADFEADGQTFFVASGWTRLGNEGKLEGQKFAETGWTQGFSDPPPQTYYGIYQQVDGFNPGDRYWAVFSGRSSSQSMGVAIGVNPNGSTDLPGIIWGSEITWDNWYDGAVTFFAQNSSVTIFIITTNHLSTPLLGEWTWADNVYTLIVPKTSPTPHPSPSPTPTPQKTISPPTGDVNCDGITTPGDALLAFQFYMEIEVPATEPCNQTREADINSDYKITPGDALCIFLSYLEQSC